MTSRMETSLIRDLLRSGATGDPGAPLNEGLTPQDLADAIPHTRHEIETKLEKLSQFSTVPVEEVKKGKYRLTSASEARKYLRSNGCITDPKSWPGLSDK